MYIKVCIILKIESYIIIIKKNLQNYIVNE